MREPAGGSAAAGVRGVAPLSDGKSQFRGGTRGPYSQAWGWRMWYLGEVVCPVMAGAGQRNVMDGKGVAVQGRVRGERGAGGVAVYAVSVFCCRLLLWSAGWDTRGGGVQRGRGWEEWCGSKRRRLSAPLVRFFALLFAPATHTTRPDCS